MGFNSGFKGLGGLSLRMAVVVAVFHKDGVNDQPHVSAAVHLRKGSTVPSD